MQILQQKKVANIEGEYYNWRNQDYHNFVRVYTKLRLLRIDSRDLISLYHYLYCSNRIINFHLDSKFLQTFFYSNYIPLPFWTLNNCAIVRNVYKFYGLFQCFGINCTLLNNVDHVRSIVMVNFHIFVSSKLDDGKCLKQLCRYSDKMVRLYSLQPFVSNFSRYKHTFIYEIFFLSSHEPHLIFSWANSWMHEGLSFIWREVKA